MKCINYNSIAARKKRIFFFLLCIFSPAYLSAQTVNPVLLKNAWPAYWISTPGNLNDGFGVYHFRRDFQIESVPMHFWVHISADTRYHLFLNGKYISEGPAKGDLAHWRFETVDLAPYLQKGRNVLAAVVWNDGKYRAAALQSYATAFILQSDIIADSVVDTNENWKVFRDTTITPIPITHKAIGNYYTAIGPGIRIDGNTYPWNWENPGFQDSSWANARQMRRGVPREGNTYDIYAGWQLVPRIIPQMTHRVQRITRVARSEGLTANNGFLNGHTVMIPAHKEVTLLLDQGFETTAFPVLSVSKGKKSRIQVTYAEALVDTAGKKGNRNDIVGKHIRGYSDVFITDGGTRREFSTLWWRTYRYIQLKITTAGQPLELNDFFGIYTAYPFNEKASFVTEDPDFGNIWNVGWRTVQLCSHETYMDCPYYEQMQYDGDTRIEGIVTSWLSGDTRLLRKAILLFNDSRTPEGLTQARYPAYNQQIIPPFSLFWVGMVHDYWMYSGDDSLMKQMLTPVHGVMNWFENHVDSTGMLGPIPRWPFVDWSFDKGGIPAGGRDGHSSILTLQYAYGLQLAAEMSKAAGYNDEAEHYTSIASKLMKAVYRTCWDPKLGLLADTPAKKEYSQHANLMAVLDGLFKGPEAKAVMEKALNDTSLIQTTYYYHFYLFQALKKAGMDDEFFKELHPWRHMLDLGLTTFAETPEPTRSDCHGWSSSPLYEYLSLVAGINPVKPGFREVSIEPHFGPLKSIEASMPVPQGTIRVSLKKSGRGLRGSIELPQGTTGIFNWNGSILKLRPGVTKVQR